MCCTLAPTWNTASSVTFFSAYTHCACVWSCCGRTGFSPSIYLSLYTDSGFAELLPDLLLFHLFLFDHLCILPSSLIPLLPLETPSVCLVLRHFVEQAWLWSKLCLLYPNTMLPPSLPPFSSLSLTYIPACYSCSPFSCYLPATSSLVLPASLFFWLY